MTPAVRLLSQQKIAHIIHQYEHDSKAQSYGNEAVEKLAVSAEKIFKTLVISDDFDNLAVAVIPVQQSLNLKLVAKHLNVKKVFMADQKKAERSTGYVLGGISPVGQRTKLSTLIDVSAKDLDTIFVSAGKRGLQIELTPTDLCLASGGRFAKIIQPK